MWEEIRNPPTDDHQNDRDVFLPEQARLERCAVIELFNRRNPRTLRSKNLCAYQWAFIRAIGSHPCSRLSPNVSFKQEWAPITRLKTDTPSSGLGLAYTPSRQLQVIGRACLCPGPERRPAQSGFNYECRHGVELEARQILSWASNRCPCRLEYKSESRLTLPEHQQNNLTGMIQFKILGF